MSPRRSRPRLVLVTGSPRSGTTAVGRALAMGSRVCTLHEPFNYHVGLRKVDNYFEIPGAGGFSAEALAERINDIRDLRLRYKSGVFPEDRGVRRALKHVLGGRSRTSYRMCKLHPNLDTIVWKDPFACFCASLLADEHEMPTVVTVRNPWAVAASFKRMGWTFDVADITERLTEAGLIEPPAWTLSPGDLATPAINGAALWSLVYAPLLEQSAGRAIHLVNLDDIVERPILAYELLYEQLGLPWSPDIAKKISDMYESRSARTLPRERRAHDQKRDLRSINSYWQELLEDDESTAVGELSGEIWERAQDAFIRLEGRDATGGGQG